MKNIKDLTEVQTLADSDQFLVETSSGSRRISRANLLIATSHNNIVRCKNLGTVTAANIDTFIATHKISEGVFEDLYLGDYFTAAYDGTNRIFRIVGFDVYYGTGDTSFTSHHIIVVPDSNLTTAAMNSTNTTGVSENEANTSGKQAFLGSDMWNIVLPEVNTKLEAVFGGHLLSHREILTNTIDANAQSSGIPSSKGCATGWEWVDCKAMLMSEVELYGANVFSSSGFDTGISNRQLPLFAIDPSFINKARAWFWLKNVATATNFCYCSSYGGSSYSYASSVGGVRPRIPLG